MTAPDNPTLNSSTSTSGAACAAGGPADGSKPDTPANGSPPAHDASPRPPVFTDDDHAGVVVTEVTCRDEPGNACVLIRARVSGDPVIEARGETLLDAIGNLAGQCFRVGAESEAVEWFEAVGRRDPRGLDETMTS